MAPTYDGTNANAVCQRGRHHPRVWGIFHALAIFLLFLLIASAPASSLTATAISAASLNTVSSQRQGAEILWDRWGVPHIYGENTEGLFYGYGWAQTHSHGDLILKLYGQARGRAAECWGEELLPSDQALQAKGLPVPSYLESDRMVHTNGIPSRAREWYEAQTLQFRRYLDAFAAGINAYAQAHPERIADQVEVVLPVNGVDVIAHTHRILHYEFLGASGYLGGVPSQAVIGQWLEQPRTASEIGNKLPVGSNAWAVAPGRTSNGHAMLLQNPHLLWGTTTCFMRRSCWRQATTPMVPAWLVSRFLPTLSMTTRVGPIPSMYLTAWTTMN